MSERLEEERAAISLLRARLGEQTADKRDQEEAANRLRKELTELVREESHLDEEAARSQARLQQIAREAQQEENQLENARQRLQQLQEGQGQLREVCQQFEMLLAGGTGEPSSTETINRILDMENMCSEPHRAKESVAMHEDPFALVLSQPVTNLAKEKNIAADPFAAVDPFGGADPFKESDVFSIDNSGQDTALSRADDPFGIATDGLFAADDPFKMGKPDPFADVKNGNAAPSQSTSASDVFGGNPFASTDSQFAVLPTRSKTPAVVASKRLANSPVPVRAKSTEVGTCFQ